MVKVAHIKAAVLLTDDTETERVQKQVTAALAAAPDIDAPGVPEVKIEER